MKMPKFFKFTKKSMWELREIAVLVFAVFLVIGLGMFINKLYAATLGEKDDGSKANFENRLYIPIRTLMEDGKTKSYVTENYFIGLNNYIIGFNSGWGSSKKFDDGITIFRPNACGNAACLCIYDANSWTDNSEVNRDKGVISCRSQAFTGKDVVFLNELKYSLPSASEQKISDLNNNFLSIYGPRYGGVRLLYIEKTYKADENRYYFYIFAIDEDKADDPANMRRKEIDNSKAPI